MTVVDFRKAMTSKKKKAKVEPPAMHDLLTSAQRAVVEHRAGPLLAGAVAGAGKSTTLVERVARLVEVEGVPLHRICLVAFNVAAAEDLNRKLKKRLKNLHVEADKLGVARTLHSLALLIHRSDPDNRHIRLDTSGTMWSRAIRESYKLTMPGGGDAEVDLVKSFAAKVRNDYLRLGTLDAPDAELMGAAAACIARKKQTLLDEESLAKVFLRANQMRERDVIPAPDGVPSAFVGFDDILWETVRMLERDQELLVAWQERFEDIIVDEGQDLCEAQWRLVEALAGSHHNLVVCGDPAQTLYTFRGARPEKLLGFPGRWDAPAIYMRENFRSGSDIIDNANRVLDAMPEGSKLPMHLVSTRGFRGFVGTAEMATPDAEAQGIMDALHAHKARGREWRDMAILVRMNDQTMPIEIRAFKSGVPLRMVSGTSFFGLLETRAMLAYFKLLVGAAEQEDFLLAISNPSRYLGKAYVETVAASGENADWLARAAACAAGGERARTFVNQALGWRASIAKGATPAQILNRILETTGYADWHSKSESDHDVASDFDVNIRRVMDFMAGFESVETMLKAVDDMRRSQKAASQSRNAVTVSTVHSAKGLEWPVVFVPGVVSRRWPVPWGSLEDELRCFFVAITRARDECWVSAYDGSGDLDSEDEPRSPFFTMIVPSAHTPPTHAIPLAGNQMALFEGGGPDASED